ncbi:hypothetical protein SAMD00023353_0601420 [Rosellinia necatrix]|uniref:Uncharacterized protein n=1 Tax=Rosellinia necatrix TaxID=77044 RepID=A0A1S7ULY7_ROSNE|nr:hypothetical protein SAMD00023353_0601420 [Rosellinia necatrix]
MMVSSSAAGRQLSGDLQGALSRLLLMTLSGEVELLCVSFLVPRLESGANSQQNLGIMNMSHKRTKPRTSTQSPVCLSCRASLDGG